MSSKLWMRATLIPLAVVAISACSDSGTPGKRRTPGVPTDVVAVDRLYRIGPSAERGGNDAEIKGRVGDIYRNVLFRAFGTAETPDAPDAPEDGDGQLRSEVELAGISPDAEGLFLEWSRLDARERTYVPLDGSQEKIAFVPPDAMLNPEKEGGVIHLRTREKAPHATHASAWLRIPEDAVMEVGLGVEQPITEALGEVRFIVEAETASGFETLLDRVVAEQAKDAEWVDVTIPLDAFAGQDTRFTFRSTPLAASPDSNVAAAPLWSLPVVHTRTGPDEHERPNVILISLDTLRADHLGAYGYHRDTSPKMDKIFEEGVLFERCMSPSSWTTPSHATAMTGLSPVIHRANGLVGFRLRDDFTTLGELGRESGQLTAAFTEGAAISGQLGFFQGYDAYSNGDGHSLIANSPGTAGKTFARAKEWLDRLGDQPFSMFIHTYEIHAAYQAPAPYDTMFMSPEDRAKPLYTPRGPELLLNQIPEDKRQYIIDMYDGEIRYTDSVVGEFFDYLDRRGLLDNTIVVIFSDHGEEFWDHGATIHGLNVYNHQLHVPLFIRFPGDDAPKGRVKQLVALSDIFATVAEFVGYDAPQRVDSFDLMPLARKESGDSEYPRDMVIGHLIQPGGDFLFVAGQTMQEKYILSTEYGKKVSPVYDYTQARKKANEEDFAAELELKFLELSTPESLFVGHAEYYFNLETDAAEQDNAFFADREHGAKQAAPLKARIKSALEAFAAQSPIKAQPTGTSAPLDQQEIDDLKSMGYL